MVGATKYFICLVRKGPDAKAFPDYIPAMNKAARFKNNKENNDASQQHVHRGENNGAGADIGKQAYFRDKWTEIGDEFLQQPDDNRPDNRPQ